MNDPKNTWKLINSLMGRNNKSIHIIGIGFNIQVLSKNDEISEAFNDYFMYIGPRLASDHV